MAKLFHPTSSRRGEPKCIRELHSEPSMARVMLKGSKEAVLHQLCSEALLSPDALPTAAQSMTARLAGY